MSEGSNQNNKLVIDLDICLDWVRKSGRVTKSKKGEEWIKIRVKEQDADQFGNVFKAYAPQTKEQKAQKDSYPTTLGRGKYYSPESKNENVSGNNTPQQSNPQTEEDIENNLPY